MKYMGSKRRMLQNGLGDLICNRAQHAERIVDLFCGAGSVAWYVAQNIALPVVAVDLQAYAITMAQAVIARSTPLDPAQVEKKWLTRARRAIARSRLMKSAMVLQAREENVGRFAQKARALCLKKRSKSRPIWTAYGGYYFSPAQALTFDFMLKYLPTEEPERTVCLAAVISAASRCAAAPGHTAQPFRPTRTASPFLLEAWNRDPLEYSRKALERICPKHAKMVGEATVADAIKFAADLKSSDLVIVDPPYSAVQYSRFYHVLETVARGYCGSVSGAGRYPPISERPQSEFSKKRTSRQALRRLFIALSKAKVTVIFTFPAGECSNGLSGKIVREMAQNWFNVEAKRIGGQFSTLGGNNSHRASRKPSNELLLLLRPRTQIRSDDI
jgi:adenine-specific DNA-methyltransferase